MLSIIAFTQVLDWAAAAITGTMAPDFTPSARPFTSSSCVSSSPSRYFMVRSSSPSATASAIASRRTPACSARSAGISMSWSSGPLAFMVMRSITPLKSDSAPMGSWMATHFRPNSSLIRSSTAAKSAFSRSILLSSIIAGSSRAEISPHISSVPTSMPEAAQTTSRAESATFRAATTSPKKSA